MKNVDIELLRRMDGRIWPRQRLALDCLFVVECDEQGYCQAFREWWHIQE